jgi:hypothetical protein
MNRFYFGPGETAVVMPGTALPAMNIHPEGR